MTELNIKNARNILLKNMKSKRMLRHSLAVSEGMKAIARHFGEDEELWGAVGLIHDVDYEFNPKEHCSHVHEILLCEGITEDIAHSISTHGYFKYPNTPMPATLMERCLYAVDRISWIGVAAAYRSADNGASLTADEILTLLESDKLGDRFSCEYIMAACKRANISHKLAAECIALGIRQNHEKISRADI